MLVLVSEYDGTCFFCVCFAVPGNVGPESEGGDESESGGFSAFLQTPLGLVTIVAVNFLLGTLIAFLWWRRKQIGKVFDKKPPVVGPSAIIPAPKGTICFAVSNSSNSLQVFSRLYLFKIA